MKDTSKIKRKIVILTTTAMLLIGSFTPFFGTLASVKASVNGQALSTGSAGSQETRQVSSLSISKPSWEKKADQIIQNGLKLRGAPYRFGAKVGSRYYDCSLFTQKVYRDNGIYLPRDSRQQYNYVNKIKKSQVRKGDLVFYDTKRDGRIDHVAIYMGNNKLLHTYKVGIGVTVSKVNNYWSSRYVGAGRVIK